MIAIGRLKGREVVEILDVEEDARLRPAGTIGWLQLDAGIGLGWIYDGKTFQPPGTDVDLLIEREGMVLDIRQFVIGLGPGIKDTPFDGLNWISEAEGDAWVKGEGLPAIAAGFIAALPANDRAAARYTLFSMTKVYRTDPLLVALAADPAAQAIGVTETAIDTLFRTFANV